MRSKFFKAHSVFHDKLCHLFADISVVPRFIPSGNAFLIARIALYKAKLSTVCVEPIKKLRIHLAVIKYFVLFVENIDGKAGLMIARAGLCNYLSRYLLSLFISIRSVLAQLRCLFVEELLLIGI